MVVATPEGLALSTVLWTMLGGYLAAGGAGAINHYLDRDRDARMARTRSRPLVSGRIEPVHGLVFGIVLGRARVRPARAHRQPALSRPRDGGPPRLRLRLHDVAEAADAAEHRDRRRRGRGAAAGRLGCRDGQPDARLALSLRDRLHVDAAPLLGALAPHQGRLRAHRRADDAGGARRGVHAPPDRDLRRAPGRAHDRAGRDRPLRRRSTWSRPSSSAACSWSSRCKLARSPSRQAALRLYLSSLAYLALLFTAMAIDRAL